MPAVRRPSLLIRCLLLCGPVVLLIAPSPAAEAPTPPPEVTLRAIFYCFWDRDYLYFSAQVDDPQLIGVNTAPMSQPWADDAVELFIHFGDAADRRPTPLSHRVAFSVAGGFSMLEGTESGDWRENLTWRIVPRTLKFTAVPNGDLNSPRARAVGYTVESAVPWRALGVSPTVGAEVAANIVVWQRGDADGFQSWSPRVHSEEDLSRPSQWATFVLTPESFGRRAVGDRLGAPFTPLPAFINGDLNPTEYLRASTVVLTRTAPLVSAKPPLDHAPPIAMRYLPCIGPYCTNTLEPTMLQPRTAFGPWMDGRRPAWQRDQLIELAEAGADLALVQVRLPSEPLEPFFALLSAMNALSADPRPIPRLAVLLHWDADAAFNADAAIAAAVDRAARIPGRDRARVLTAGGPRCLVALDPPPAGTDAPDFPDRLRAALAAALGEPVVVIGHRAWAAATDEGPAYRGLTEPLTVAAISPVSSGPGPGGRQEGRVYRSEWLTALAARPQLFLINSWNDFITGDAVAPTRQFGLQYRDATQRFATQAGGLASTVIEVQPPLPLQPLQPGVRHQLPLVLDNRGAEAITPRDRVSIYYELRSLPGDDVVSEGPAVNGYLTLAAGSRVQVFAFIGTVGSNGEAIRAGDYALRLRLVQAAVPLLQSRRLQQTLATYQFPVRVGEPAAPGLEVLNNTVGHDPRRGAQAVLVLRNGTRRKVNLREARLAYRWRQGESTTPPQAVRLGGSVNAGEATTTTAEVIVPAVAVARNPSLATLEWGVLDSDGGWAATLPGPGGAASLLLQSDGVNFLNGQLTESREGLAARVTLRNDGDAILKTQERSVVWMWYRWDGRESDLGKLVGSLPDDIKPGDAVTLRATMPRPPAGNYYLAVYLSESGRMVHGPSDIWWTPYRSGSGRHTDIPIGEAATRVVATSELRREEGLFTNDGESLPSEQLPPDLSAAGSAWFPCGYYTDTLGCSTNFRYPAQTEGTARALVPNGQHFPIDAPRASSIHLLTASAEGTATLPVVLHFADGSTATHTLTIGDWNAPAPPGAHTAWQSRYRHTLEGFVRRPGYLHDYALSFPSSPALTGLTLQAAPAVRVVAITIESADE